MVWHESDFVLDDLICSLKGHILDVGELNTHSIELIHENCIVVFTFMLDLIVPLLKFQRFT